jgi:tetratricopeptide (TPR) repeat protein
LERLAALLIRQGNDSAALDYLQRLLGTDSLPLHKRLDVLLTCGNACARAENLDSAFAYYQQGLELTGERDLRFLNNKGALYLRQARLEAAIDTFHQSLDLNETQPNTHYGLGSAYLAGGNLKLALEHFAESLEIKIDQPHVLYQLIRCSHQLNSHATAARILADYIDEVTSSPSLNYTLAGLQFTLGRNNECAMTLAKILMVNPNHTHALELRERNRKISAEKKVSL